MNSKNRENMNIEELREKRATLKKKSDITLNNMNKIIDESYRVADVARNSDEIINDLDQEFESATGLQGNDVKFLFAATGLQIARIVILNELTKVEKAGGGNSKESKLHELQEKLLKNFNCDDEPERPYYASMKHIITRFGVPYDATAYLTEKSIENLMGKNRIWDFDLEDLIPSSDEKKLFVGANHRFSTLGHDPILGLIFGTGNIMTNTITCVKTPIEVGGISIPVLTTNHVVYTSDFKDPRIATRGLTSIMLKNAIERTMDQPQVFVASLIKQILHIGTDLYTPCGIQIPFMNLILSNTNVEKLTKYVSTGDLIKVGTSMKLAEFINTIISAIHTLMYDPTSIYSRDIYNVRTRKIILYSNAIVTGSNAIWVGANVAYGDKSQIKNLDIGGLLVLVKRLYTDTEFIRQIKEEFVLGGFKKMIQGDDLNLEDTIWE